MPRTNKKRKNYRNLHISKTKKTVKAVEKEDEVQVIPSVNLIQETRKCKEQNADTATGTETAAQIHQLQTDLPDGGTISTCARGKKLTESRIIEVLQSPDSQPTSQTAQLEPEVTADLSSPENLTTKHIDTNENIPIPHLDSTTTSKLQKVDNTTLVISNEKAERYVDDSVSLNIKSPSTAAVVRNGAILSDLDLINVVETLEPPQAININYIESDDFKEPPISPSTLTEEVVIRTSHDFENNIILEEIDILAITTDQSMDTSTPIASPSISTIIQNIESDNLSSFRIITPNSSLCADSPLNDQTYAPSGDGESSSKSDVTSEMPIKKKRKVKKKSDPGKTRKLNKAEWIDVKRKRSLNEGSSYVSRDGKLRLEKTILPPCDDHCRLKCTTKINEDVRQQIFKRYWSLGDRGRQWELLARWCERMHKRRITTEGPSKRIFSVKYSLPVTLESAIDDQVRVCKKMFLNTFGIGEGIVKTALKKIAKGDGVTVGRDERGRHPNHRRVKSCDMIKSVCDHVKSLNPVESHYTRKNSSKLYLDAGLSMTQMFKLYNEWVPASVLEKAKTLRQYIDIVNENFNIEFHRPKKDQCDDCIAYKNQLKPVTQEIYEQHQEHLKNKDRARSLKNEDKLSAINSPQTIVTAAFDFQKVHSCPHAATSILYYKRKLNIFNFTMFEMGTKVGKCYMWHEGTARRGANEVASCVYEFIKEHSANGIKTINLYSDNCGGQNRNRIVFMMYLIAAKKFNVDITHRFLEKGHTQNENDSIHALIERCSKNKEIYTPDQWFALVRWAKENKDAYIVKEIGTDDIIDFKKILSGKNWTKNEKNQKVMWSKIREIHVESMEPDVLCYKMDFDETYHRIYVRRSQNRRRPNQEDDELVQAYTGPLPIPNAKLIDLKYLCEHNVIPRQYHGFYNSLRPGDVVVSSSEEED